MELATMVVIVVSSVDNNNQLNTNRLSFAKRVNALKGWDYTRPG